MRDMFYWCIDFEKFLARTPPRTGVPQQFSTKHSRIDLQFSVRTPITLGLGGNLTKLFHVTCRGAGMIIWVQLFGAAYINFGRAKNDQNSARFWTTSDFDREHIDELWSTNKKVIGAHIDLPTVKFFGRLYFGP